MKTLQIILIIIIALNAEYSPNLKYSHELDQFILRISHRYSIDFPTTLFSKPMHASDIINFLEKVDSLDMEGVLTEQESYRLKNLKNIFKEKRSIFKWQDEELETENYINLLLNGYIYPFSQEYKDIHLKGTISPIFSGVLGRLSYFTEIDIWTEYQSDTSFKMSTYEPYDGNPYNLFGRAKYSSIRSSDLFRGGISYQGKKLHFETAVDYLRQGPVSYFPLTFSGENSPVTYFRARMDLFKLKYIHTFGLLRTQKDKPKYFYTHRLDFSLFQNKVHCGLNSVIINGSTSQKAQSDSLQKDFYEEERTWEWVYMIPFIPYAFAEHYVGDRDNAVLSFDFSLSFPKNFRWYCEIFIDDISSPVTLFSDDYGNKLAITIGGQWFGIFLERDVTFTMEYSRIEPWVYTHFYGGSHRYTHFGKSLGSVLGPNSDAFISILDYALTSHNSIGLSITNIRKNEKARGGSILHVFQNNKSSNPDSEKKKFLGSDYDRLTKFDVFWKLTPFGMFNMIAKVSYDSDNKTGLQLSGGFSF